MDEDAMQSAETRGSGQSVNIIMPNARWQNAVLVAALAFAMFAVALGWQAEREARLAEYYGIDLEMYIAKQHLQPPPDPWGHNKPKEN